MQKRIPDCCLKTKHNFTLASHGTLLQDRREEHTSETINGGYKITGSHQVLVCGYLKCRDQSLHPTTVYLNCNVVLLMHNQTANLCQESVLGYKFKHKMTQI
jgi:hypothetical protein